MSFLVAVVLHFCGGGVSDLMGGVSHLVVGVSHLVPLRKGVLRKGINELREESVMQTDRPYGRRRGRLQ